MPSKAWNTWIKSSTLTSHQSDVHHARILQRILMPLLRFERFLRKWQSRVSVAIHLDVSPLTSKVDVVRHVRGEGIVKIEMNFLPDVYVPCEICQGKRYNREALEIHYKGKSIADVYWT